MAKTFFENFRRADPVYPGIKWGADEDGNVRSGGIVRNIYGPDPIGNYNTANYKERVAVPFRYFARDPKTDNVYDRKGILYVPYSESKHIFSDGSTREGVNDIQAYGAEIYDVLTDGSEPMGSRSLNVKGLNDFMNDPNNFGFTFDVKSYDNKNNEWGRSAEVAERLSGEKYRADKTDAGRYKVNKNDFLKNLRMLMGNKEL